MPDRTVNQHDEARRLATPEELEFVRDMIGFTPGRKTITQPDWTVHVDVVAGDDDNQGVYSDQPLATLQAAIAKMPFDRSVRTVIQLGAGEFDGATIGEITGYKTPGILQAVEIKGTVQEYTPASGVSSGTASAGGTDANGRLTLTKPSGAANWTANDLVGKRIRITNGNGPAEAFIVANSTTLITTGFVHHPDGPYDNTSEFVIEDWATRIKNTHAGSTTKLFELYNVQGFVQFTDLDIFPDSSIANAVGIDAHQANILKFEGCRFGGDATGKHATPVVLNDVRLAILNLCLFDSVGGVSGSINGVLDKSYCTFFQPPANVNGAEVTAAFGASRIDNCYFAGDAQALRGVVIEDSRLAITNTQIEDFANDGIKATRSMITLATVSGDTNADYALALHPNANAHVGASVDIAGTTADFWVNAYIAAWTSIPNVGDTVTDLYTLAGIVRV